MQRKNLLDDILLRLEPKVKSDIWLPIFYEARKRKKTGVLDLDKLVREFI